MRGYSEGNEARWEANGVDVTQRDSWGIFLILWQINCIQRKERQEEHQSETKKWVIITEDQSEEEQSYCICCHASFLVLHRNNSSCNTLLTALCPKVICDMERKWSMMLREKNPLQVTSFSRRMRVTLMRSKGIVSLSLFFSLLPTLFSLVSSLKSHCYVSFCDKR